MKRPGTGLIGQKLERVLGKRLKKDYKKDYQLKEKILNDNLYFYRLNKNKSIQQSIDYLSENGIKNIELSGGQHDPDIFKN